MYCKKNVTGHNLFDQFIIINKIGGGSFGDVYYAFDKNKKICALKTEKKNSHSRLKYEYEIYVHLNNKKFGDGIPKMYSYIELPLYDILVMQMMGDNLEKIYHKMKNKFDDKIICDIAIQIINLLKKMHNCGVLHRDIKPSNFVLDGNNNNKLCIMDFGLSKKFINDDGTHIKFKKTKSFIGTTRYASEYVHNGIEPSRRDDLISLGYMLMYFMKGKLPWQGKKKNYVKKYKQEMPIEKLCHNMPSYICKYIWYCKHLEFDEFPNYDYLSNLFNEHIM